VFDIKHVLGTTIVKNHTGRGVAESMIEQLEKFKIVESQVEGGSFDGQYLHLSISEHLQELLNKAVHILCTWIHCTGLE
jgi:hypothetical protein